MLLGQGRTKDLHYRPCRRRHSKCARLGGAGPASKLLHVNVEQPALFGICGVEDIRGEWKFERDGPGIGSGDDTRAPAGRITHCDSHAARC